MFSTPCPFCRQIQEPYLENEKVFCSLCDKEIPNISKFSINLMKTLKQVRQKKKISLAIKCQSCNNEDRPIVLNNDIACSKCKKTLNHLTTIFKNLLKEQLKTIDRDA